MNLSWAYINVIAESIFYHTFNPGGEPYKSTFAKIEEEGLTNSVIRLGLVINHDYTGTFYNVFETTEQREKGAAILKELRDIFR